MRVRRGKVFSALSVSARERKGSGFGSHDCSEGAFAAPVTIAINPDRAPCGEYETEDCEQYLLAHVIHKGHVGNSFACAGMRRACTATGGPFGLFGNSGDSCPTGLYAVCRQGAPRCRFVSPTIDARAGAAEALGDTGFRAGYIRPRYRQIAYDSLEAPLVGVVILPLPEVADVARPQLGSPRLLGFHHGVVQADRKEHGLSALAFLFKRRGDFVFDPATRVGMFRDDEQELVAIPNGLVDRIEDLRTNREIVWRKPAADALVLQVCVQPISKLLVLRRVTDEARVELEGLVQKGGRVIDQSVWQSDTTKEWQR